MPVKAGIPKISGGYKITGPRVFAGVATFYEVVTRDKKADALPIAMRPLHFLPVQGKS